METSYRKEKSEARFVRVITVVEWGVVGGWFGWWLALVVAVVGVSLAGGEAWGVCSLVASVAVARGGCVGSGARRGEFARWWRGLGSLLASSEEW